VSALAEWWNGLSATEIVWVAIGLFGQSMFMMRFLIQWITSERANRSVIPETFWYFSIAGGLIVLAYGIHRADPVIIIGQLTGVGIYSRNIYFIWRDKRRADAEAPTKTPAQL